MKYSQLYMLLGGMCFVGSLLTSKLSSSLMLLFMFLFWQISAIYVMPKEFKMEKIERKLERAKFDLIVQLLDKGGKRDGFNNHKRKTGI